MKKFIIGTIFIILSLNVVAKDVQLLQANEWLLPKKASIILDMPALYKSMQSMHNNVKSTLLIKYPGGDEGTLWVYELRSWLVALGVSSQRLELVQGSAASSTIELKVLVN